MAKKEETTFYKFYSNVRSFLSKLISSPISAKPNKFLRDRDFSKEKLINILIKRSILERHEKIDDDNKKPQYVVKYRVKKANFEKKIHEIYDTYFKDGIRIDESVFKDEDKMKRDILNDKMLGKRYRECGGIPLDECDCGGCMGGGCDGGSLFGDGGGDYGHNDGNSSEHSGEYTPVVKKPIRRGTNFYKGTDKKLKENKKKRTIFITEAQFKELKSIFLNENAGDVILNEEEFASVGANNASASGEYTVPFGAKKGDPTLDRTPGKVAMSDVGGKGTASKRVKGI